MTPGRTVVPLARLMGMGLRLMIDELHATLVREGFHEIRPALGFVLLLLKTRRASIREIADTLGMSKQAASKIVQSMEETGLVARAVDEGDARVWQIGLTDRGREMLDVVERTYRELERDWARIIGRAAIEDMRSGLERVLRETHDGELPPVRPVW